MQFHTSMKDLLLHINVLQQIGRKPGKFMVDGMKTIDWRRYLKADKEVCEQNKKKRYWEGIYEDQGRGWTKTGILP